MGVLAELEQNYDVKVEWKPFELRPGPKPMFRLKGEVADQSWQNSVAPLAKKMGVFMERPIIIPHTREALEAAEFAREMGKYEEYHLALFKALFQEGEDIEDTDVLIELAERVGLDGVKLKEALDAKRYGDEVDRSMAEARRLGVQVIPSYVINDIVYPGLQDYRVLAKAVEQAQKD